MGFERKMYDVTGMNLKCAQCGKAVTDGSRPVYCQECNRGRARSGGFRSGGYNRGGYRGR